MITVDDSEQHKQIIYSNRIGGNKQGRLELNTMQLQMDAVWNLTEKSCWGKYSQVHFKKGLYSTLERRLLMNTREKITDEHQREDY